MLNKCSWRNLFLLPENRPPKLLQRLLSIKPLRTACQHAERAEKSSKREEEYVFSNVQTVQLILYHHITSRMISLKKLLISYHLGIWPNGCRHSWSGDAMQRNWWQWKNSCMQNKKLHAVRSKRCSLAKEWKTKPGLAQSTCPEGKHLMSALLVNILQILNWCIVVPY